MIHIKEHIDIAYRWAENRKLAINPVTGAMQLVVFERATESLPAATTGAAGAFIHGAHADAGASSDVAPLFGMLDNQQLLRRRSPSTV